MAGERKVVRVRQCSGYGSGQGARGEREGGGTEHPLKPVGVSAPAETSAGEGGGVIK